MCNIELYLLQDCFQLKDSRALIETSLFYVASLMLTPHIEYLWQGDGQTQ
jgi:hypothetical protein